MNDLEERAVGDLTVRIDRLLCVGFGDCIELAPDIFDFDGEGIATFVEEMDEPAREKLFAACESCPVDALVVLDAEGRQLAP